MRFTIGSSDASSGLARVTGMLVGLVAALALAATASAGDISAQPGDSLSISGAPAQMLPQTQGTGEGWLSGLHVSGFATQTFGMWQNPTALKDFTPSRNNLAVARSLLQTDINYRLSEQNSFFLRTWFVYEPPYSFDSANNTAYGAATNLVTANPFCAGNPNCITTVPGSSSFGHYMNGYYNDYEVRDAWWENKTGPLTTYIGNQIVVWGQSIAFRVGDVINPQDTCWAFGFANLEQSRVPQWMIHPILNLPDLGPLSSNFAEAVIEPGFQPRYWPEQSYDPYNKYRFDLKAGREDPCFPSASHGPSARFDVHYDNRAVFGADAPLTSHPGPFYGPMGAGLVSTPASREFFLCSQLAPGVKRGFNPYPKAFIHPCALGLTKHEGNYGPIGDGQLVDIGFWRIPGMQPRNWNEGFRLHTLIGPTEYTLFYYNDNASFGTPWTAKWTPYTNLWNYSFYPIENVGATMDRPLPIPSSLAEYFPAVMRAEINYQNHVSQDTMQFSAFTAQAWSDVVKWMAAIDLDQAYAPWLTSTGNLSANVEVYDQILMDNSKYLYVGDDLNERTIKNDVSVLLNIGTSWWWSDFAPTWTMIYAPKGNTFLLFPAIVLTPPWTNKYFVKFQAIEVLGGDREGPEGGLFKGESLLTAQLEYNFNLL